jgi:hypothetical protein
MQHQGARLRNRQTAHCGKMTVAADQPAVAHSARSASLADLDTVPPAPHRPATPSSRSGSFLNASFHPRHRVPGAKIRAIVRAARRGEWAIALGQAPGGRPSVLRRSGRAVLRWRRLRWGTCRGVMAGGPVRAPATSSPETCSVDALGTQALVKRNRGRSSPCSATPAASS